jgi:biopolymer transport protein ExbD
MNGGIDIGGARRPRRPSLTPLIDVVFLLLVFFMLASRFGGESALGVSAGGGGETWSGPPRLVDIGAGTVRLNGIDVTPETLAEALAPLVAAMDDPVVLRVGADADVQALAAALSRLEAAGFRRLVVME